MDVNAIRGGIGFLTRLPIGRDETAWQTFIRSPTAFPICGYIIGCLLVIPLLLPLPAVTVALVFISWLYLLTGITHLDGVADLGDGVVVHGDANERYAVMKDTSLGVGGVGALVWVIGGIGLAAYGMASLQVEWAVLLGIVVAAEVGAKLGMVLASRHSAELPAGMGATLARSNASQSMIPALLLAVPVIFITFPSPVGLGTILSALCGALFVWWWSSRNLPGITGDVLGAINETARLAGLHGGLLVWMLW